MINWGMVGGKEGKEEDFINTPSLSGWEEVSLIKQAFSYRKVWKI